MSGRMWWLCIAALAAGACASETSNQADQRLVAPTVVVRADGLFDPPILEITNGTVVTFEIETPGDSIVPATDNGTFCPTPNAHTGDGDDFTGPLVTSPGGVWVLGPEDTSRTVLPSTWSDPSITGVFLRFRWNEIQTGPVNAADPSDDSMFDWSILDAEIDAARVHRKLFKLTIGAGKRGTPDWIFSAGGAEALTFRDAGSDSENATFFGPLVAGERCGSLMTIGNPADPVYGELFRTGLKRVAEHLRARADRFRALGYMKMSGANLLTYENRLPKRCTEGCTLCTPEIWANAAHPYQPSLLYDFYRRQLNTLANQLPGKGIAYALIQAGFPRVGETGAYLDATCTEVNPDVLNPVPGSTEQTRAIVDAAIASPHTAVFAVEHDGAGPANLQNIVVTKGSVDRVTGYQTQNNASIPDVATLEAVFDNIRLNDPNAAFVEIYEERLLSVQANGGALTA